jgi:hypothetical protein
MRMTRVMVQVPEHVKVKLDKLRDQGVGTSWFVRRAVERALRQASIKNQKGR